VNGGKIKSCGNIFSYSYSNFRYDDMTLGTLLVLQGAQRNNSIRVVRKWYPCFFLCLGLLLDDDISLQFSNL